MIKLTVNGDKAKLLELLSELDIALIVDDISEGIISKLPRKVIDALNLSQSGIDTVMTN